MFLLPFRPGTTHVMQLGPVWIGHRAQPAPPSGDRVDAAAWGRDRKQHSRYVRICRPGHSYLPLGSAQAFICGAFLAVPADAFLIGRYAG